MDDIVVTTIGSQLFLAGFFTFIGIIIGKCCPDKVITRDGKFGPRSLGH